MRVLVVAGGSGGHIYPAISFLERLKESCSDTLLVLPKRSLKNKLYSLDFKLKYVSIVPVELRFNLKLFGAVLRFLKGVFQSLFLLVEFRPDVVVGFGCIESIPVMFFAWIFRVKTLIHEQNVLPGKANRLLAAFVDTIAISFPETKMYLKDFRNKTVLTGNPVRRELERLDKKEALDFFGFKDDKFTILVTGGSQGSHSINMSFIKSAGILDKSKIQIIHLTGAKDYLSLNKCYKNLGVESKLFDFFKAMHYAYSACDLIISRAGATTITEITFFKLPAILIPYPYAYKHQLANAEVLQKKGCALIINDEDLCSDALQKAIESLLNFPAKLKEMRSCYDILSANNAAESLVNEITTLLSL